MKSKVLFSLVLSILLNSCTTPPVIEKTATPLTSKTPSPELNTTPKSDLPNIGIATTIPIPSDTSSVSKILKILTNTQTADSAFSSPKEESFEASNGKEMQQAKIAYAIHRGLPYSADKDTRDEKDNVVSSLNAILKKQGLSLLDTESGMGGSRLFYVRDELFCELSAEYENNILTIHCGEFENIKAITDSVLAGKKKMEEFIKNGGWID